MTTSSVTYSPGSAITMFIWAPDHKPSLKCANARCKNGYFTPADPRAIYCSPSCRNAANQRAWQARQNDD